MAVKAVASGPPAAPEPYGAAAAPGAHGPAAGSAGPAADAATAGRPRQPAPAGARLFIALWPSVRLARAFHGWYAAAAPRHGSAVAPARLHLTLYFLGQVPVPYLPDLQAALCVPFSPFELRFTGCELWPRGLVVARPASVPQPLLDLRAALALRVAALGLRGADGRFSPHVTLARRHAGPAPLPPACSSALRWPVRQYVLVESLPGPYGHYRLLQNCRATAAAERAA